MIKINPEIQTNFGIYNFLCIVYLLSIVFTLITLSAIK